MGIDCQLVSLKKGGKMIAIIGWKRILLDLEDADFQFETLDVAILFKKILP